LPAAAQCNNLNKKMIIVAMIVSSALLIAYKYQMTSSSAFSPVSGPSSAASCDILGNGNWVIGEPRLYGLSNQLFSVFAYVPIAQLLGVNLLVGPMYSRQSFSQTLVEFQQNSVELPFNDFFDFDFFSSYWGKKGLRVLDYRPLKHCVGTADRAVQGDADHSTSSGAKVVVWNRTDFFRRHSDEELVAMAALSDISVPLPPGARTVVRIEGNYGIWGLYNYFHNYTYENSSAESTRRLRLLAEVYLSLKPAPHIAEIVNHVLHTIGAPFVGIHVRVERDMLKTFSRGRFLSREGP
jgi:hypothetical protein